MAYIANETRYDNMPYRRSGNSGLLLPAISLGLWHNFGRNACYQNSEEIILGAFDRGITCFDVANNYGPPAGAAEEMFGEVLNRALRPYRDELVVTTKAGYYMGPGPYGDWGSRKNLISSLNQSLKRMNLEYVDIFYHHRPDPNTPLEETAQALADIVRSGKALYVGISNYNPEDTARMVDLLAEKHTPCLVHQMKYSMLARQNEAVIEVLTQKGVGSTAFSPLAQGVLTGKYNDGIPEDSRAIVDKRFLKAETISQTDIEKTRKLQKIADERGQSMAQLALAWVLRENGGVTSVIIGASKLSQIEENLAACNNLQFTEQELEEINKILQ